MSFDIVKSSYLFGFSECENPNTKSLIGFEIFPEKIRNFTSIKSIKIWYGIPPDESAIQSLLGIQIMYLNYFTGERKLTEYQGVPLIDSNIENIYTKELVIKSDDYLSKFYIGCNQFITHLKFETKKGDFIEFGTIDENFEKNSVNDVNEGKNIIINIRGNKSQKGIRALGVDFMSYKNFFYNRLIILFRLRHKINHQDKDKYNNPEEVNKLNYEMKCALKICQLPDTHFFSIIKYL